MRAISDITILVVDDEPQIRRTLRATLSGRGYEVLEARSGQEALDAIGRERPDVVLLDVNLPDMTGLEVCRMIRSCLEGPIIMVTVRNTEADKIAALDSGADDYLVKPFAVGELLARIRATLRRVSSSDSLGRIQAPGLTIDFEKRLVELGGERIRLTPKAFDVLQELASHRSKPVTHEKLLQTVWGPGHGGDTENLRVVIKQLRKKIEKDPAHPRYILTDPWTGYRLEIPGAREKT